MESIKKGGSSWWNGAFCFLLAAVVTFAGQYSSSPLGVAAFVPPRTSTALPLGQGWKQQVVASSSVMDFLSEIPVGAPDPILGIAEDFKACTDPKKVNVCVGAYRDDDGKPYVLPSVLEAERRLLNDATTNKEYAPITGDAQFVKLALEFAYGKEVDLDEYLAGVQTLSGTGACRVAAEFYAKFLPHGTRVYIPTPTWGNHIKIFQTGGLQVERYRHFDASTNGLDWEGMMQDLSAAPEGSVILFHACAHNPTGCDPTMEQWQQLSALCHEKKLFVLFDSAYQGFASGDAEADAAALRLFVSEGHNLLLCQSFAKNFGLYGERCGTLSVVCNNREEKEAVLSQLRLIIRPMYSSPPIHGSLIVRTVLADDKLRAQYYVECQTLADRIRAMRQLLVSELAKAGSTHDWSHVTNQIGMFAFTGLSAEMCDQLTANYSIFLTRDGRISLAGVNAGNVEYVAQAVHQVTVGKEITRK